jgi:hypothetical protein
MREEKKRKDSVSGLLVHIYEASLGLGMFRVTLFPIRFARKNVEFEVNGHSAGAPGDSHKNCETIHLIVAGDRTLFLLASHSQHCALKAVFIHLILFFGV